MAQQWKFGGKQYSEELGLNTYDFGARLYDPATAKWFSIDAFAEKYYDQSPYNYALNNPVYFIDPDGNMVEVCCDVLKGIVQGVINFGVSVATPLIVPVVQVGTAALDGDFVPALELGVPAIRITNSIISAEKSFSDGDIQSGTATVTEEVLTIGASFAGSKLVKGSGKAKGNAKPNYTKLKEPNNGGKGNKFTKAQKARILQENKETNSGVLKSDMSGKTLDAPVQSKKGVKANMNQAEVDHINSRSKGGTNSNRNAQVLSKEENLKKGNN